MLKAKMPTLPAKSKTSIGSRRPNIDTVIRSFNTWSYKREQPSDVGLMHDVVAAAVAQTMPIPFVLYWGKGPRTAIAEPDFACLDYLLSMVRRIEESYEHGASVTLLLTDSHATLNGYGHSDIDAYFADVTNAASERRFDCRRLNDVTQCSAHMADQHANCTIPPEILSTLTLSAAKWYNGKETPEVAAQKYYAMNMVERAAVQRAYRRHIFVTFNSSDHRPLFPECMPIFYMYSIKKGMAVKPWFLSCSNQPLSTWPRSTHRVNDGPQPLQPHRPAAAPA